MISQSGHEIGRLSAFRADAGGLAAIEFALIAPVMVLLLLGAATYFVSGRDDYRIKRATYTAADMISRQKTVDSTFLANVKTMAEHIARHDARTMGYRVSSVVKTESGPVVAWSYAESPYTKRSSADVPAGAIPDMSAGESVVLIESSWDSTPLFRLFGNAAERRENLSVARPRVVRQIQKTD